MATNASRRPVLLASLLAMSAVAYAVGGARLAILGGSWYYLGGGLAQLAAATLLLWRRHLGALWLYISFLCVTIAWAVLEAGLDGWALAPRLIVPAVLGLWLGGT